MRKKVAIAVVALLGGALMLPNHEALAHGGGFGGGGFRGGAFGGRAFAMDMDAATMVTGADMDMGSATDTTAVTEAMLAIPSIPTTSVATIRTAGLIPFAGDCRAFLLALSNRQPGAELGTHRN
jgi:hypothetical protein